MKIAIMALLILSSCKLQKNLGDYGDGTSLFAIDGSGLRAISGVNSTKKAGSFAVENNYLPSAMSNSRGLQLQSASAVSQINHRCGLKAGMTVVMALSYLDGQTTGQLGGKAVLCKEMRGELYQSIEWQDGELCFSPQNNTTKQLVRAPGHTDGPSSLMSLTEYCENYTDFFLSLGKPQGLALNSAASTTEIPDADTLYRGGLEASRGNVQISLAGSSLSFSGRDSFVLTHNEGGAAEGLYLRGESHFDGATVKAYHEGGVGFRGFTFSEKGKGESAVAWTEPEDQTGAGTGTWSSVSSSDNLQGYKLQGAPSAEQLGLEPPTSGVSRDRDMKGGEFQVFWK